MKRQKVLLILSNCATFVKKDYDILSKNFDVRHIHWTNKKFYVFLLRLIKGILWADVSFSWFANYHAFWAVRLSKVFRKKSIVVIGGYEVAKVPEINYGAMLNARLVPIVKYVLDKADRIITVDDGLKKDAIENAGVSGENITTVPTGYDSDVFKPKGIKEDLIISVSTGNNWDRIRLKGVDTFVKSAKFMKDTKFIIIGIKGDALKKLQDIASPNVVFIDRIPQEALVPYYQKAKVYCQLSMREGLPNALCEAMLCECVPVGTDVQGVRTAIGDAGFYVPYSDPKDTAEAINMAMNSDKGKDARERIKNMFPIERREKELVQMIKEVLQSE